MAARDSPESTVSAQIRKLNLSEDVCQAARQHDSLCDAPNHRLTRGQNPDNTPSELVAQVDDLLNQLGAKFSGLSSEILGKMDDMSRRLDNLEATIQAGNAQADSQSDS
ncbi:putative heat shock factor binding protein [Teratosphaeria destructans]|uniref:Heat shock factor binding protein n=1 Tax=Teratosphaeria destructans TaxID=418781 RepID=A0A9W7W6E8_9PEZI|nr:putative heat shock factor binding protein [Teratosphaeria destructans]